MEIIKWDQQSVVDSLIKEVRNDFSMEKNYGDMNENVNCDIYINCNYHCQWCLL